MTLPNNCPTSISYSAPRFPVRTFNAISGATSRFLFSDSASNATLNAEFSLNNADAAAWLAAYNTSLGSFRAVTIPADFWSSAPEIEAQIPSYLVWYFTNGSPPQLDRLTPNRVRLRIQLIGVLEA